MASSRITRRLSVLLLPLVFAVDVAAQQPDQAGSSGQEPTTVSPEARAAFDRALDTWIRFRTSEAMPMYEEAIRHDATFALPRVLRIGELPYEARSSELDRAVKDAASATAGELLLAAAAREAHRGNTHAARTLRETATQLIADRRLALQAAWMLPPAQRLPVLRDLVREHPDFAPAAAAVAWTLVPNPFATVDDDGLVEAESSARAALRLEPQEPYTHAVMAQVLVRKGERDEARTHLGHATGMDVYFGGAYQMLAQMDLQDGRIPEARATLERALATESSPAARRNLRRAIALTRLHEYDLAAALDDHETIAADAEADGFPSVAGSYYANAAIIAAGADDADAFDRYRALAEERLPPTSNPEWLIIGNAFLGRHAEAARALNGYLDMLAGDDSPATEETRERMRGYVALAAGREADAVEHFQRAGRNPYSQLGLWEAHRRLGNREAARAAREDMLTRKDFTIFSTATPTARYRARHMD